MIFGIPVDWEPVELPENADWNTITMLLTSAAMFDLGFSEPSLFEHFVGENPSRWNHCLRDGVVWIRPDLKNGLKTMINTYGKKEE